MIQHRTPPLLAILTAAGVCLVLTASAADEPAGKRDRSFDNGWLFLQADAPDAEAPSFYDATPPDAFNSSSKTGCPR